jgi:hypothetical protein
MSYIDKFKTKDYFWATISVILCLILLLPLFKKYYLAPNSFMYAFGGDALTLYYNVVYHTCHGSGTMLKNMNYPDGELIFLTDAQGALSLLLSFINRNLFSVCDYVLGIIHSLQILSMMAGAALMYYLYKGLNVMPWRASVFSALTIAMSPQIGRIIPHHGLSYVFIIPMILVWLLRKHNLARIEKRDFIVLILLFFFGFNNPYIGAISSLTILTYLVAKFLLARSISKMFVYQFLFGLLPILSIAIYFKIFDPYDDRLKYQWGFYTFASKLEGLFFTPRSLFDKVINAMGFSSFTVQYEACINLGFSVTIVLFIFTLIYLLRKKILSDFTIPDYLKYIFIGAVFIFLYSSNVIFAPLSKETVETKLGALLMFKAVGRLGWPLWFALVITAVVLIEQLLKKMALSGYLYTIVLFILFWLMDYMVYYRPVFNGHENDNIFKKANKEITLQDLKKYGIDDKKYQAVLSLPRLVGWSDVFLSENNFMNQFLPWKVSAATGLPIVNGMYSRVSTGHVQERIQFYSNPLIEKTLQNKFPNKKPILIIYGKPNLVLSEGEQYLLSISKKLYEENDFAYYELALDSLNRYPLLQSLKRGEKPSDTNCNTCILQSHDESVSTLHYAGGGSKFIAGGEIEYLNLTIPTAEDSIYEYSVWTHVDKKSFGSYQHIITVMDANNTVLQSSEIFGQNTADVHGEWSRSTVRINIKSGNKIKAVLRSKLGFTIDEVLLRPISKNHFKENKSEVLYNGFKVIR